MKPIGFRKSIVSFSFILLIHFTFFSVAYAQNLNTPPAKKNSHPKMSSYLQKLEKDHKEGTDVASMIAQGMNMSASAPDRVTVYLMSETGTSVDETALYDLGARNFKHADNVIRAEVPIDMLTAVADTIDGVSFMKTPDKLIPVAVESEGVDLTGADSYGYTGSGVKIAVFDVGFIGLSNAISNNELPNNVVKVDCTVFPCDSNNPSLETVSYHGTAVAEIIHDMAPGATLYLVKVSDRIDLKDAKDYGIENGINIINLSGGYFNQNFYDGKCWSTNAVCTSNSAWANDILWVNAAGNEAQRHYEAVFTDSDSDGWHNVSGSDETISISAKDGDTIEVYLTWDAWPTTDQDYDLYLYNSLDTENPVASSQTNQTGTQWPTEKIVYPVKENGTYYLSILQENAVSNHSMEIYSIYHDLSPAVASSSLLGPADAAGAIAVGAINYNNWATGPQEPFSSQGPTNDGRIKPDIMGPDNVSNYTSLNIDGIRFTGTSASTPHVAGAAALVLDKFPGISVDQLWNFLTSTAVDMGVEGKDNIYGYGRLRLDINAAIPSSTTVTTGGGGGGGGCFIATAAYGSYAAPCVRILRDMRDRFLIKSSFGKRLVNLYYTYSPPLADFIGNHDNVKLCVRMGLLPLVGISWLALKCGPVLTISLMVLFVFAVVRLFTNRSISNKEVI